MKKLIILIFVSLFSINVYSADVRILNIQNFKLDSKITSTLVEKTKKIEELHIYQENKDIYVLGWSKDGKIAFIENRGIDGRGGRWKKSGSRKCGGTDLPHRMTEESGTSPLFVDNIEKY